MFNGKHLNYSVQNLLCEIERADNPPQDTSYESIFEKVRAITVAFTQFDRAFDCMDEGFEIPDLSREEKLSIAINAVKIASEEGNTNAQGMTLASVAALLLSK